MSRYYGMKLTILNYSPEKEGEIKDAAMAEWDFQDHHWGKSEDGDGALSCYGESFLCGGESEDGFIQRLTEAIWKAHGAFCEVSVEAVYLEAAPCAEYSLDIDDYDRWRPGNDARPHFRDGDSRRRHHRKGSFELCDPQVDLVHHWDISLAFGDEESGPMALTFP